VLSASLRTGIVSRVAGERLPMLADLAGMKPKEMERAMWRLGKSFGHRLAALLVGRKTLALVPLAGLMLRFSRLRGYTGLYLYCLARKNNAVKNGAGAVCVGI
jgi:hypothetical protein